MRSILLVSSYAILSCARPPPPASAPPLAADAPAPRSIGPLLGLGLGEDRARPNDGAPKPDGKPDYIFRVRISGDVAAIVLHSSDSLGNPIAADILDTYVGPIPIPPALHASFKNGAKTWTVAVVRQDGSLVNPAGFIPTGTVFRDEVVTLYASAVWPLYREGRAFVVMVVRPDGRIDRSTALIIDTPG